MTYLILAPVATAGPMMGPRGHQLYRHNIKCISLQSQHHLANRSQNFYFGRVKDPNWKNDTVCQNVKTYCSSKDIKSWLEAAVPCL